MMQVSLLALVAGAALPLSVLISPAPVEGLLLNTRLEKRRMESKKFVPLATGAKQKISKSDIDEKILAKACEAQPANVKAYLFAIARNAVADRWRQRRPEHTDAGMDGIAEESLGFDELTPERFFDARQELSRFEEGMKALPERCREVIRLRKVEGFSAKEVAAQMGVGIDSVHHQTMFGMRALVDFLLGGNGRIQRPTSVAKFRKAKP